MIATNIAEPMIDQIIGNAVSPTRIVNSSGSDIVRASHIPSSAPMNPRAIDPRQPAREYPAIDWPRTPHTPATNRSIRKSIIGASPQIHFQCAVKSIAGNDLCKVYAAAGSQRID
jgi:hypothetical protein